MKLLLTRFVVDERHRLTVCDAPVEFRVKNVLPPLANALAALAANGAVILALLAHHKDLH
jgi:hypothetical protein